MSRDCRAKLLISHAAISTPYEYIQKLFVYICSLRFQQKGVSGPEMHPAPGGKRTMTKRIKHPGGHGLVGFPFQRKLSPRRLVQLEYLRLHRELWDLDLKSLVRELQTAGILSPRTPWVSCAALKVVLDICRAEVGDTGGNPNFWSFKAPYRKRAQKKAAR
jgi:hypothetical protein